MANMFLFKYEKFNVIKEILYTKYFVKSKSSLNSIFFPSFRFYLYSLDFRNQRLKERMITYMGNMLVERANYNGNDFKDLLLDVDLILYYISKLQEHYHWWFPTTYIYKSNGHSNELISKMARKRDFDKIKVVFNVDSIDDLKELIRTKS